jgi:hypothetical protein
MDLQEAQRNWLNTVLISANNVLNLDLLAIPAENVDVL